MSEYITGHVRAIISTTEVLLELKPEGKAEPGMEFVVYEEGDPITDSDGKFIARFEREKARVRITNVQRGLAYAESARSERYWTADYPAPYEPDPSDYMDYEPEDPGWSWRPVPIADTPKPSEIKSKSPLSEPSGGPRPLKEMLRAGLKHPKVVKDDLVRSATPIG